MRINEKARLNVQVFFFTLTYITSVMFSLLVSSNIIILLILQVKYGTIIQNV